MISLYDSQISQILPESLAEKSEVQALSYAINNAIKSLIEYCRKTSVYARIEELDEEYLDLLALELNTQYYDTSLPIETKRELIMNTFIWYEGAGTSKAVEDLVAVVFGEGSVSEWFDYGDDPYYFKILTNAQLTPGIYEQFQKIIARTKNVRSHIRTVEIYRQVDQPEYLGAGVISSPKISVTNSPQREYQIGESRSVGVGAISSPHIIIRGNNATKAEAAGMLHGAVAVVASPHVVVNNTP